MAELVILIENKSDVAGALKLKIHLKDKGIIVSGIVMPEGHPLPPVFIEDIMKLEVTGYLC